MSALEPPAKPTPKRDELIRQAFHVFFKDGLHATGVDTVLIGTGISKRTLYKYFSSKEELIAATVNYYTHLMSRQIRTCLEASKLSADKKILLMFDIEAEFLTATDFCGCYAINAKLEFTHKNAAIETACTSFFDEITRVFAGLSAAAGHKNPHDLAQQLLLLLQGAIINTQSQKETTPFTLAKAAAEILLKAHS